jgi:hypothetical protein
MLSSRWLEDGVKQKSTKGASCKQASSKPGRSHQLHQIWRRSDLLFHPRFSPPQQKIPPSLAATDIEPRSPREARHDAGTAPATRLHELQHPTAPNQRPIFNGPSQPVRLAHPQLNTPATLRIPAFACLQASCVPTWSLRGKGSSDAGACPPMSFSLIVPPPLFSPVA